MTNKVPALAQILRNAGFTWASADEITAAIDAVGLPGCSSDDVAGALFRWRRKGEVAALSQARRKAQQTLVGNGTDQTVADAVSLHEPAGEVEGQLDLFGTADERARLGNALAMRHGE